MEVIGTLQFETFLGVAISQSINSLKTRDQVSFFYPLFSSWLTSKWTRQIERLLFFIKTWTEVSNEFTLTGLDTSLTSIHSRQILCEVARYPRISDPALLYSLSKSECSASFNRLCIHLHSTLYPPTEWPVINAPQPHLSINIATFVLAWPLEGGHPAAHINIPVRPNGQRREREQQQKHGSPNSGGSPHLTAANLEGDQHVVRGLQGKRIYSLWNTRNQHKDELQNRLLSGEYRTALSEFESGKLGGISEKPHLRVG